MKRKLYAFTAHAAMVLGAAFMILLGIEGAYPFLSFIESTPGRWLLLLLCLSAVFSGMGLSSALHKHGHHPQKTTRPKHKN